MEGSELPADVVQFIAAQIDTVPHLEALLLLWESAPRTWSAEEIAARIYVARDVAVQILQDLERRRLVRAAEGAAERLVYDAAWDATGDLMARVAATYRQNLIRVARSIHARAPSAVREFARAFEIKKEE
jgi:hypothetical protein